jgi:hypothetical protein
MVREVGKLKRRKQRSMVFDQAGMGYLLLAVAGLFVALFLAYRT